MPSSLIASYCSSDLVYVFSLYLRLSRDKLSRCQICVASEAHQHQVIAFFNNQSLQLDPNDFFISKSAHTNKILSRSFDKLYIFTLGSYLSCHLVLSFLYSKHTVVYDDCYFHSAYISSRYQEPLRYLFSRKGSPFCSRKRLVYQLLCQLSLDPLRKNFFFAADSHCWLTKKALSSIYFHTTQTELVSLSSRVHAPSKALIFVLSRTDNDIDFPWSYFSKLDYTLFYKPHPSSKADYSYYPEYVSPIYSSYKSEEIIIPHDSFIIGISSNALSHHHLSISLIEILRPFANELTKQYAQKASFLPATIDELSSILQS